MDPKGLIAEAYRIEGIGPSECRSIFLDWALSLPEEYEQRAALQDLADRYAAHGPNHPMTEVIQDGLNGTQKPKRRGGWRSRQRN